MTGGRPLDTRLSPWYGPPCEHSSPIGGTVSGAHPAATPDSPTIGNGLSAFLFSHFLPILLRQSVGELQ